MKLKKQLLEYLVRTCVREVISQVKEADSGANKSDFYTDKEGSWCKWCGSKAVVDACGVKRCKNTTCKLGRQGQKSQGRPKGLTEENVPDDLKFRILKLVEKHPEILTMENPFDLLKIPEFKYRDIQPTLGQVQAALEKVKAVYRQSKGLGESASDDYEIRDEPKDEKTGRVGTSVYKKGSDKPEATWRGRRQRGDAEDWIGYQSQKTNEAGEPTQGAPAPPADGTGSGENLGIPKEKDTTPEPPSSPETPPVPLKGILFINPRDKSNAIPLFQEPKAPPAPAPKKKPGRKPKAKNPEAPAPAAPTSTPETPPVTEALSPMTAYSNISPKQMDDAMIERVLYYTAAKFAGPKVKVANSTMRAVKEAIKHDGTLFLYIGKYDETSDEIYVLADKSIQIAKDGSLPPSELSGTSAPPAPSGADDFDPNVATGDDIAAYLDKDAPGKVRAYGPPEDPEDLGDVGEQKINELKRMVKKIVNGVLNG